MEKKIQYIENNQTRLLSKICKEAGYSKCLCHIWRHNLYFNDPATPEDYGIWFSYGENGWQKTCRTMDPWYDKIYKELCKHFPNGIEGLELPPKLDSIKRQPKLADLEAKRRLSKHVNESESKEAKCTMFIGMKNYHEDVRTPTIDQPLFLANTLKYALSYVDGHTALSENESGYIQVVKFPKAYFTDVLDLVSDMADVCKQLEFPDLMTAIHMHCGGMQWYASVVAGSFIYKIASRLGEKVFDECKNGEDIISKYKDGKNSRGDRQSLSWIATMLTLDLNDFDYCSRKYLDANSPKLNAQSIVQFIRWINNNSSLTALLPTYVKSARPSSIKESYKLTSAIYFKKINELGYSGFANLEGEGDNSWCLGIIDQKFKDICECTCYKSNDSELDKYSSR